MSQNFNVILRSENKLTGSNADATYNINWYASMPTDKGSKYKLKSQFISTDYDNNDDVYTGGVRYNKNSGLVQINLNPISSEIDTSTTSTGSIIGIAKREYGVVSNTSVSYYKYTIDESLPLVVDGGNFPTLVNVKLLPNGTQYANVSLLYSSNAGKTGNATDFMGSYILGLTFEKLK